MAQQIWTFSKPFPTRVKATSGGVASLAASTKVDVSGSDARQAGKAFIVSNLDASLPLYIRTSNGVAYLPVWPKESKIIESGADFQVYNPDGANPVSYLIAQEIYDDQQIAGNAVQLGLSQGGGSGGGGGGGSGGGGNYGGGGSGFGGGQQYTP
jgi:uncharacterized membrane protein YgcG